MSGARFEDERVSGVCCHSMQSLAFLSMLGQYRKLLFSAYGPKGGTILISNAVGRNNLASSASEITKQLSFCHPCIKYINALISAQNVSCGLSGLYTGILCVRLLEEALEMEDGTPHHVITDVSEWVISQLLTSVAQFPSQVVTPLDIGDMKQVTAFVKTILGSKSCLNLNKDEQDNLSLQIVKAFLKSIPQDCSAEKFGHVHILQRASSESDALVIEGMLYREPDFDTKLHKKISLLPKDVSIILFAVPLLPNEAATESVLWKGTQSKEKQFINKIVPCILSYLRDRNIHILTNQKAIHPVIKFEIERQGYIVIERLGTVATDTLMKLSGCQAITNLSNLAQQMQYATLGKVSSIQHISLGEKDYLLLNQANSCISTLLLPGVSPTIEETLKETTESCLAALKMVVVDGKVVAGGGCFETWLATQVSHLVFSNMGHLISLADAPRHHIIRVANAFIRVFMRLAIQVSGGCSTTKFDWCTDSVFHHLWHSESVTLSAAGKTDAPQRCVCGLLTDEIIKERYGGEWHQVDFQLNEDLAKSSFESNCLCDVMTVVDKTNSDVNDQSQKFMCDSESAEDLLGIEADSLEETIPVEDDVDSLEKTSNSLEELEEEGDSLEGRLESLDDDVDSLEDVLDKVEEQLHSKNNHPQVIFDFQTQNVLYDCYLAKYNALRLAMEGFSQLFQIGQCVYDP